MRRTGKSWSVPAMGMNVPCTVKGVRSAASARAGRAPVAPPAATRAAVFRRSRRRILSMGYRSSKVAGRPSIAAWAVLGDRSLEAREEFRIRREIALRDAARFGLGERSARFVPRRHRRQVSAFVKILRSAPAVRVPRPRETVTHASRIGGLELAPGLALRSGWGKPHRDRANLGVVIVGNDGDARARRCPEQERAGAPAFRKRAENPQAS